MMCADPRRDIAGLNVSCCLVARSAPPIGALDPQSNSSPLVIAVVEHAINHLASFGQRCDTVPTDQQIGRAEEIEIGDHCARLASPHLCRPSHSRQGLTVSGIGLQGISPGILNMTTLRRLSSLVLILLMLGAPRPAAAQSGWQMAAPLPKAIGEIVSVVVRGKIYVLSGLDTAPGPATHTPTGLNWEYDPASNSWTAKKPMPAPAHHVMAAVWQDKIMYSVASPGRRHSPLGNQPPITGCMTLRRTLGSRLLLCQPLAAPVRPSR